VTGMSRKGGHRLDGGLTSGSRQGLLGHKSLIGSIFLTKTHQRSYKTYNLKHQIYTKK